LRKLPTSVAVRARLSASVRRLPIITAARARCARNDDRYAISRSESRNVLAIITSRWRSSAARITPFAIAAKYGSSMSWTRMPTTLVDDFASACACAFGV
jgi:hypothetical protein